MDLKWIVLVLIVLAAGAVYSRAMRRSGASWAEVFYPWGHKALAGSKNERESRPAAE